MTTSRQLIADDPKLVRRVVARFVRGARFIAEEPNEAAALSADYIGVSATFIRQALEHNRPNVAARTNSIT